jgi:cell division protein FtsW
MGESSFVNGSYTRASRAARQAGPRRGAPEKEPAPGGSTTGAKAVARRGAGFDWPLVGVIVGLTLFGLLMVYSAGPKFAVEIGKRPDHFLIRQSIWAVVGIAAALVLSRIPYRIYQRITVPMMFVTVFMLIAVAILADTTLGSNRSILSGSIRPSELAKLVTIIYVSVWLTAKREVLNDITLGLFPLMFILGVTGGLILIQPDLSAAITVILLGGILFFLSGGEWRQITLTIAVTALIGWVVVNIYPTGIQRIKDYMDGLHNLANASYHVQRSLEAIINGGLIGVGIGHSSTKFTGLPVAPTDSIFAVIAEETGLVGAGLVILAYLIVLWRGIEIARNAQDHLGSLLASGITIWIVVEALLNMAVMVNLLPHAGNALPLISYGGSNMTVTLLGVGILLNIARASGDRKSSKGGGTFASIVDLRWRDRRGRVSRFGRPASPRQ